MNECNFSEKLMSINDKNGLSREGSSRVSIYKETGLPNCYTLEVNYHTGKRINFLSPKLIRNSYNAVEPETPVTDQSSKMYLNTTSPVYNIEIFEDIGNALCIAILDFIDNNPVSRVPLSAYKNLGGVRSDIETNLAKYEVGNMVGNGGKN
eukprot:CAMPEP_0202968416 /NCGR_PEP_ID=MMETSP1396-20130829/13681_1 /ASSEMBLY_ACC=CAM_ASM_000872 /TAXON_ID= /ORGANISM="Pseudokeronopsis sp., Strain Brazil" /LENGTH=150 /DNA_ID=CAMNT_0049694681 /DNA_START=526 /DNA_END=978 /DNA_ORIENTATION=+